MEVALNKGGVLSSRGLPVCPKGRLLSTTNAEALARCGSALVGSGGLTARTSLPNQQAYLLHGEILLFNSRLEGRQAILAHVYERDPAPITRVFHFKIRRQGGTYGTVISADIPEALSRNGYIKSIFLRLQRTYRVRGKERAFLKAKCPLPAGVRVASFPFARASMTFSDGRTLRASLTRSCRVRG